MAHAKNKILFVKLLFRGLTAVKLAGKVLAWLMEIVLLNSKPQQPLNQELLTYTVLRSSMEFVKSAQMATTSVKVKNYVSRLTLFAEDSIIQLGFVHNAIKDSLLLMASVLSLLLFQFLIVLQTTVGNAPSV